MSNCDNKSIQKRIRAEAQELAETYNLSVIESSSVLDKIAKLNWYDPDYAIYSELEKAFEYMSPHEALELFNKEDLTQLATRVLVVEYLNNRITPLYTLDRLAELSKEFIIHLEKNKEHLLQTGFPKSTFEKSPWLNKHLNKLYYYKLPIFEQHTLKSYKNNPAKALSWQDNPIVSKIMRSYDIGDNERLIYENLEQMLTEQERLMLLNTLKATLVPDYDIHEDLSFHYMWAKSAGVFDFEASSPEDLGLVKNNDYYEILRLTHEDISETTTANYEEANIIKGFSEEDVSKIIRLREKLFNLKISVLERLIEATISKSKIRLISDCTSIINDYLTTEEMSFLISKDHFYSNYLYGKEGASHNILNGTSLIYHNAGLSDLFKVIGHFYKEIKLLTMDEAFKSFKDLPDQKLPDSYYASIGKPWQDNLDHILYYYSRLEDREKVFWKGYRKQVNSMLKNKPNVIKKDLHDSEFQVSLPLMMSGLQVTATEASQVSIVIESIEEYLNTVLSSGGAISINIEPIKVLKPSTGYYTFEKAGDNWNVIYEGEAITLDDSIGVKHISYLLMNPNQMFPALTLYLLSNSNLPVDLNEIKKRIYDDNSIGVQGMGSQIILDAQAVEEYKKRIEQINYELESANTCSDQVKIEKLKEEKTFILNELNKSKGLGNRKRRFSDESERARKTVSKAINSVIDRLNNKTYLPPLSNHFKLTIKTGYKVSYMPEENIPWKL